jgi:hypothetical protein
MAWITPHQVSPLVGRDLAGDEWIEQLIGHCQGLAEVEIGVRTEPVPAGLQSVLADIVARFWRATKMAEANPAGFQQDQTGPFMVTAPQAGAAGLGLTDREKKLLRKAVGQSPFWVQPLSRADQLETPPITRVDIDSLDNYGSGLTDKLDDSAWA